MTTGQSRWKKHFLQSRQIQSIKTSPVWRITLHQTRCGSHLGLNNWDKNSISLSSLPPAASCTHRTALQHQTKITDRGLDGESWWIQKRRECAARLKDVSELLDYYTNRKYIHQAPCGSLLFVNHSSSLRSIVYPSLRVLTGALKDNQ